MKTKRGSNPGVGKYESLDRLMEKHGDALDAAYELGFQAAYPELCLSAPMMSRGERGEATCRDCDYEVWNLKKMIQARIKFIKTLAVDFEEDIKCAESWAKFFSKSANQFEHLGRWLKKRKDKEL